MASSAARARARRARERRADVVATRVPVATRDAVNVAARAALAALASLEATADRLTRYDGATAPHAPAWRPPYGAGYVLADRARDEATRAHVAILQDTPIGGW